MCIYDTTTYDCGARKYHLTYDCKSPSLCKKEIRWHEFKAGLCEDCTIASFGNPFIVVWNPFYPPQNACGQSGFLDAARHTDFEDAFDPDFEVTNGACEIDWGLTLSENDSGFSNEEEVWFDAEEYIDDADGVIPDWRASYPWA